MPLTEVRCTAPGRYHQYRKRICGRMGAKSKVTQKMTGVTPLEGFSAQPMWLCSRHWGDYPEVEAISGKPMPKRSFPS